MNVYLLISIASLIILLGILFAFLKYKKRNPTDYYAMFTIGLIWSIFGIYFIIKDRGNPIYFLIGLVFLYFGLKNKDKWKKNRKSLKQLNNSERKITMILFIALGVIVFATFLLFYLSA